MKDDDEEHESIKDMRNDMWFKENYIELMQKHLQEWIAVMDQKIIANGALKTDVDVRANEIAGDEEYSLCFILPTATVTDAGYSHR
ncbi:MAG: hypothetical protein MIO90_06420 [Methanomassiliicoccales archaeon]|nr:hypothetical protein [Methanomassiliicoccales archaeon]